VLAAQCLACHQHRPHQRQQPRFLAKQLDDACFEPRHGDRPDLEAKGFERAADFVADGDLLFEQHATIAEQQAQLLALWGLDMDRGEPPSAHGVRDGAGVVTVGLDRRRRGRPFHAPGLDASRRQPRRSHSRMQPRRQRAGFEPEARKCQVSSNDSRVKVVRFRGDFALPDNNAILVDDAHSGLVERHIQACEILHVILPVLLSIILHRAVSLTLEAVSTRHGPRCRLLSGEQPSVRAGAVGQVCPKVGGILGASSNEHCQ
jgi:hypothetical protein